MRGILYYFSGTGNTKWVAERFKEEFSRFSIDINVKNIERIEEIEMEEYDYLIIGTPVHSELPPKKVIDFVNKLPEVNKSLKCIVYSTQGVPSGVPVSYIGQILEKKGFNVLVRCSFRMANSYYFGFGVERTQEEIAKFSKKAEEKVKVIVEEFLKGRKFVERAFAPKMFFAKISAKSFNKLLPKLSSKLSSTDECTKCELCLKNCPNGNITIENGRAIFHSNCMMCTRCIHLCPSNAIRYKGKKINQIMKDRIKVLDLR